MSDPTLSFASVSQLLERLREGSLSPVELVGNCIERIEEVNPVLNCFCFTYPDEALEQARVAEKQLRRTSEAPPLAGLPIAFKDLTPTAGKRTTLGSHAFEHWVPDRSSIIVERFEAAGAILIGKTTTPEFAYDGFTYSPLWGHTRNPWDPDHTPGGSSGGSAAAVASGCVPWAEGCDMGGSVRLPAAFCGLVGLKPSLGRIPMDLIPSALDTISHFGPLARGIDDAALFMRFAQGPDDRDLLSLESKLRFEVPVRAPPRPKLALSMDLGHMAVDAEVQASVLSAVERLRASGATVEEVNLDWPAEIVQCAVDHWKVYLAAFFGEHLAQFRERMDPHVVELMDQAQSIGAVEYKRMEILRSECWHKLLRILSEYDALLSPTATTTAPPVGAGYTDLLGTTEDGKVKGLELTAPFNLMGQCPALSVPIGFSDQGLPFSLHIAGRRFDDEGVLGIAKAIEDLYGAFPRSLPLGSERAAPR